MPYFPKIYFKNRWILGSLIATILIHVSTWIYLILNLKPSDKPIFLHYNILSGIDLVGNWWNIYYLAVAGSVVILLNYFLSFFFYHTDKMLARLLVVMTNGIELFLFIGIFLIVEVNI
jgi:hypothetical protein